MQALICRAALLAVCTLTLASGQQFFEFAVDQDKLAGAPDFGFLNHPLTAADRLIAANGHFFRVGNDLKPNTSDDERVRLFGLNLAFGANFPAESDAPRIARRLRRLGVNLVRLHHMDSSPDRDPENAASILTRGPYPTLNPVSVRRLRAFLTALRAEGIYVNVNLKVGYVFRPEVDHVPAMPGNRDFPFQSKPLQMFYPRMVELEVEYARALLTALGLANDPVLGMVEINNESSMLEAWQNGQLDREVAGAYQIELQKQWNAYLAAHGYTGPERPLVTAKDAAADSKLTDQFLSFLVECDRGFLGRMLAAVREAVGPLVPVTGSQMGYGGLLNLESQAAMDYLDNHFYIDHYQFPNRPWDERDWRIRDSSAVGSGLGAYLNMAASRVAGRPYTVSEFNQPYPNRQAAELDPTLAAFAAFQDWDGLVHFAYSHGHDWDHSMPGGFNIDGDWQKVPGFGQSAWLFRSGAVQTGKNVVELPVSTDLELQAGRERRNGNIASFLATIGYSPTVALLHPVALVKKAGTMPSEPLPLQPSLQSDTAELSYNRNTKVFTIDAPQAAGVFGFIGANHSATAGVMDVQLASSARGFAAILLTSLDGRPLRESTRMLLSNPGFVLATVAGSEPPRMQKLVPYADANGWWTFEKDAAFPGKPSGAREGARPIWMERVESVVTLRSTAASLVVYPLDGSGTRKRALPASEVRSMDGGFRVHVQADGQELSPWYEIVAERNGTN
jgi:hypothetical protein